MNTALLMRPIADTPEILGLKALGRDVDQTWIDWAYSMLLAGFDTEHLRILAGEHAPFDQFALQHLTDKVFMELGIDTSNKDGLIHNYISHIAQRVLNRELEAFHALGLLKELYMELGHDPFLWKCYALYHAKADLLVDVNQWYVDGATRANIDDLILEHFRTRQ